MKTYKIAIVGSRSFNDFNRFCEELETLKLERIEEIVSGGALGVDALAKRFAFENNLAYKEFLPRFKRDGKIYNVKDYFERNREIAEYSDAIIAFWDRKSKGTKYTIDYARKIGKRVRIIEI